MDTKRAQHMPENSLLMQMGCQSTHWAAVTCLSGFPVLMSRLPVVFPCHPGCRKAHTRLWVPSTGCEQGLSPRHHKQLFVSGLCPQPQLVLTW